MSKSMLEDRSKKLLWIEDNISDFKFTISRLKDNGIITTTATDENEWLKILSSKNLYFDLIFLDIMLMKGVTKRSESAKAMRTQGYSLLKKIKKKWPNTPVVVLSARMQENINLGQLGISEYLTKPCAVSKIIDTALFWTSNE